MRKRQARLKVLVLVWQERKFGIRIRTALSEPLSHTGSAAVRHLADDDKISDDKINTGVRADPRAGSADVQFRLSLFVGWLVTVATGVCGQSWHHL
jgi:hypothetical protein